MIKKNNLNQTITGTLLLLVVCILSFLSSEAQYRSYNRVYSDNLKGGTLMFGNTLMTKVTNNGAADTTAMNNNRATGNSNYTNNSSDMRYVDIDGAAGLGAETRNSSSADLVLPSGTNDIKFARLYWGGRVLRNQFNLTVDSCKKIKIRHSTSNYYLELTAQQIDKNTSGNGNSTANQYQAFADITSYVQSKKGGTYIVGNAALSTGSTSSGNYGGWCIVIVYENKNLPNYNSVRVYDGFSEVATSVPVSLVTLSGLNVPSGAINQRDAKMGVMSWEGDANLTGDYFKINNINFSNQINAINNPWNGTISDTGTHVTNRNPAYTNQMGIDIDQFYIGTGYGITPGATSVNLEFGTEQDQYFPGLFVFQIKTNDPTITMTKTVKDANNNQFAEPGEQLTYTLKCKNIGIGNANKILVTDTLPNTITYVPGSMKIISGAGGVLTDAVGDDLGEYVVNGTNKIIVCRGGTGATITEGGILAPLDSFIVEFKATINVPGLGNVVPPIMNIARVFAMSDADVITTDDGTAILLAEGGPLPVTLKFFNANMINNNSIQLNWGTSMEINCASYIVERSFDGKSFVSAGSILGAGNTTLSKNYSLIDLLGNNSNNFIYYRLVQVDIDGKKSYSKTVSVRLNKNNNDLIVSPNPFNSFVNVNFESNQSELSTIKVIDARGKELISKKIQLIKGSNYIQLNELQQLPKGNYFLQFNTADGNVFKQISKQ